MAGFYVAGTVIRGEGLTAFAAFVAVVLGFGAMCAVYFLKDKVDRAELDEAQLDRKLSEEARKRQHGEK